MPDLPLNKHSIKNWVEEIREGSVRTVARSCSLIENEEPWSEELLSLLYPYSGSAIVIGITGPPGAGKSTLLSGLINEAVNHKYKVGVIAVDPSSPLSGGALLADRLRFTSINPDQVYIRSLATRGMRGGLAAAAFGILRVLEAMGKGIIFVETVGTGQNEISITDLATTTVFVTVPNLGDEIQALKAGILEVSDIFVVNKADLGNSDLTISQLRSALTLKDLSETSSTVSSPASNPLNAQKNIGWPAILPASALQKKGIVQLFSTILSHHEFIKNSGELNARRKKQIAAELFSILEQRVIAEVKEKLSEKVLSSLLSKKTAPHALARKILSKR